MSAEASASMTDTTFRIEEGVPFVGDRAYPWAVEVWLRDDGEVWGAEFPEGFYEGFRLRTENAWEMQVIWSVGCEDDPDLRWTFTCRHLDRQGDLHPSGAQAIVDCSAVGLHDSYNGTPEGDQWPHGTPFNWSFPRLYLTSQDRIEKVLADMSKQPSPTWPI